MTAVIAVIDDELVPLAQTGHASQLSLAGRPMLRDDLVLSDDDDPAAARSREDAHETGPSQAEIASAWSPQRPLARFDVSEWVEPVAHVLPASGTCPLLTFESSNPTRSAWRSARATAGRDGGRVSNADPVIEACGRPVSLR